MAIVFVNTAVKHYKVYRKVGLNVIIQTDSMCKKNNAINLGETRQDKTNKKERAQKLLSKTLVKSILTFN